VKDRKKEEEQVKEKLFEIQKRYVEHRETKFEPFQLSSGQPKMGKLKEEAEEDFRRQHPFRPERVERMR
jgi:antirestriction protein